jgi:hypothetical protein
LALERLDGQTSKQQSGRELAEAFPWMPGRPWQAHPPTYRQVELETLARWISAGVSGSVIGMPGVGRSNLLGFLCHRPEALAPYLPTPAPSVLLVPVDLNLLPDPTLATFYRVLLRAFYELRTGLPVNLQEFATQLFFDYQAASDPFLPQSALRMLLFYLQAHGQRVVLVMDRFDAFCRMITPELGDTLSGLRDSFRDTLSYLVGVRQSLAYLETLDLASDLVRTLTTHTYTLGPLCPADARQLIERRTRNLGAPPTEPEIAEMLALTGGYPMLLKLLCEWWLLTPARPPLDQWFATLSAMPALQRRLHEIWAGLTQEEQQILGDLALGHERKPIDELRQQRQHAVQQALVEKGLCRPTAGGPLFSTLFQAYVEQQGAASRGAIWLEEPTQLLYQGPTPVAGLTPKERAVLEFFVKYPRQPHSYTDVIVSAWSDDERYHGVTNDSLFQVIRGLRQKIEPHPATPVYVINWRGKPEGGYLFFPEGRPS